MEDFTEKFELVLVLRAIFQGNSDTLACTVVDEDFIHLVVIIITCLIRQVGRPAAKMCRADGCVEKMRCVDGAAQFIERRLAHKRRWVFDRKIGRGMADYAK